jgi:hypothetical protein
MKNFTKIIALISTTPIFLAFLGQIEKDKTYFVSFQNPLPTCWFLQTYGVPCASCGLTRGWICIAHGDIDKAILFNPNSFSTFITIIFISIILWTLVLKDFSKRTVIFLYSAILILFSIAWAPIIEKNIALYKLYGVKIL